MQALSIPQDVSLEAFAQAERNLGDTRTAEEEEVACANIDAVFEFAGRFILIKALPGWIEEIYAEHLQSAQPVFASTKGSGSIQAATGAHNADPSVWEKTQATI